MDLMKKFACVVVFFVGERAGRGEVVWECCAGSCDGWLVDISINIHLTSAKCRFGTMTIFKEHSLAKSHFFYSRKQLKIFPISNGLWSFGKFSFFIM